MLRAVDYQRRIIDDELDVLCSGAPAISLEGAKGVGKSATGAQRARTTFLLEQPVVREVVDADPGQVLAEGPVLIDEWQQVPATWDVVRRAVDAGAPPGQFLLTGSASGVNPGTHSGAGRILSIRMRPLSLAERGPVGPTVSLAGLLAGGKAPVAGRSDLDLVGYVAEIVTSGFPGIRRMAEGVRRGQLTSYLTRVVDRDFAELGHPVRNPAGLRRWLAAYAAATATTATFETIRDAATSGQGDKPARSTAIPYRDILERLYVLDPLPAWLPFSSRLRELASSPKHHLADPALAAALVGLNAEALLRGDEGTVPFPRQGSFLGALFESLVTQSLHVYAQAAEASVAHFRTHRGEREVDLIVQRPDGRVVAAEVKLAATVGDGDVRHLLWLADRLGPDLMDAVVITTGPQAYRRPDGIAVIPAALLGP